METDAFSTLRRARSLHERHPHAPSSVLHVALVMATYADGRTGRNIRPGYENLARATGLHIQTVKRAIGWLERHGELWRVKEGHNGSAACFTYRLHDPEVGGASDTPYSEKGVHSVEVGGVSDTPHPPHPQNPSGPSRPSGDGEPGEPGVDGPPACAWEGCEAPGVVKNFGDHWCERHAAEMYRKAMSH